MKFKIIIGIVIFVIAAVFINIEIGNVMAKKIDLKLQSSSIIKSHIKELNYSDISVNPLTSRITFHNLYINNGYIITSRELNIKLSYKEVLHLINNKDINISGLDLSATHSQYIRGLDTISTPFLNLQFEGLIKNNSIADFIKQSQILDLKISDLKFTNSNLCGLLWDSKNDSINNLNVTLCNNAKEKQIKVEEFKLNSTLLNIKTEGSYSYSTLHNPKKIKFKNQISSCAKSIQFIDTSTHMIYTLKKFKNNLSGTLYFNNNRDLNRNKSHANISTNIYNLSTPLNSKASKILNLAGINIDNINIDKCVLNGNLNNGDIFLSNSYLKSSLFNIDIESQIGYNITNPKYSSIKKAALTINILNPDLKNGISNIGSLLGLNTTYANNKIMLTLKGTLGNIALDGIHYKR